MIPLVSSPTSRHRFSYFRSRRFVKINFVSKLGLSYCNIMPENLTKALKGISIMRGNSERKGHYMYVGSGRNGTWPKVPNMIKEPRLH